MLEKIENYAISISDDEDFVLKELTRKTNLTVLMPRMLSGHLQGKLLEFISKIMQPKKILEIGTFTGYSTVCFSKGLADGGTITTIEINIELETIISEFLQKAKIENKVNLIFGDALEIIPGLGNDFDLVFLDADKRYYLKYYKLIIDKIKKGGIILADNIFWSGKVLEKVEKNDLYTKGILEFNEFIKNDNRVEKFALPIRDGLYVIRKK
jgi:predicted O-methyltransferase YrrM